MHGIQRCQMIGEFAVDLDARQRHATQSPQHHLRRRLRRLPSRLSRIDAGERGACVPQIAPHDELHQHQHAQRDAQQADQPDDPMVVPQKQWRQRQGATFQPPEALFDQVLAAIRGDALGQADLLGGVVGRIDAPAQALRGVTLSRIKSDGKLIYNLTPLNAVQKRILSLMEVPLESYDGLVT